MKAQQGTYHREAMIDGLGGRPRMLVQLKPHIVSQGRFIDLRQRECSGAPPPAGEVQQIIGISAQRARRELTKQLGIQKIVAQGPISSPFASSRR